jgi:signal peptidase I
MTALRWTRRILDGVLIAAIGCVLAIATITVAAQVLGGRSLILAGGSMEPTMPKGSYVLILPVAAGDYAVGDVVTVASAGATPYTHRITRLVSLPSGMYVETKGDANATPEPIVVPVSALAGRVAGSVPVLGYVASILASPIGLVGFLLVCLAVLVVIWLIEEVEEHECAACAAVRERLRTVAAMQTGSTASVGPAVFPLAAAAAPAVTTATALPVLSLRHDSSGSTVRRREDARAAAAAAVAAGVPAFSDRAEQAPEPPEADAA